jgi:pimeloyl-ACP methyl ester carboxylesterase
LNAKAEASLTTSRLTQCLKRTIIPRIVRILPLIYPVLALVLWLTQELLLFPILAVELLTSEPIAPPQPGISSFMVPTPDGAELEVRTTFGSTPGLTSPYVAIIFHGNGETVGNANFLPFFAKHKIPAFTFDYRGYGNSTGWPSERKLLDDGEVIWHAVQAHTGVDPAHTIILGNSIGTGMASYLASRINPRVTVLLAAYATIPEIIRDSPGYSLFSWVLRYRLATTSYLATAKMNCLILAHGKLDSIIKFRHLELVSKSAQHPGIEKIVPLTSELASHNDVFYKVEPELDAALESCLK